MSRAPSAVRVQETARGPRGGRSLASHPRPTGPGFCGVPAFCRLGPEMRDSIHPRFIAAPYNALRSKRKLPNARGVRLVARFELYRDEGGEYRWRFRADNNEIVASGEGYRSREDCEHAVQLIKEQVPQAEVTDRT
jgi:uncharacterized protein YegP (UPF0339 family)